VKVTENILFYTSLQNLLFLRGMPGTGTKYVIPVVKLNFHFKTNSSEVLT
jgi:hypothetical protein